MDNFLCNIDLWKGARQQVAIVSFSKVDLMTCCQHPLQFEGCLIDALKLREFCKYPALQHKNICCHFQAAEEKFNRKHPDIPSATIDFTRIEVGLASMRIFRTKSARIR